ncbi:MAG TPA: ribose 5-phosphate isomerase A [Gemmatimonadaceae bacterium]|nr:ribose 5-phosphate isomerase A [Gemmatimonadaceae bacterium]
MDAYAVPKRAAAVEAAARLQSGMVVGLGTGSTSAFAIAEIGRRIAHGELRDIVGIPTSNRAHRLALEHGIPLATLESHPVVDVTIDGADEIDPERRVLKGAGGALLREKIVAARSRRWIVIADESKLTPRLGTRHPLPVEVVRFGWRGQLDTLRELGADAALRMGDAESPFVTDEGHYIIDARFPDGIGHPAALAEALRHRPGVVETGLFLGFSPELIIG